MRDRIWAEKGNSGFTLIEMIVVIAIMAVMLAIAVPGFLGMTPRSSLKTAARDMISNLQLARIEAIRGRKTWAVQFDTGSARYRILDDDGADDTWNTTDDNVYKTVNFSDYRDVSYGSAQGARPGGTVQTDGVTFSAERVTFKSDGSSESGTVYIKNANGDTFAVGSLSAAGRIKSWRNYGSGWKE